MMNWTGAHPIDVGGGHQRAQQQLGRALVWRKMFFELHHDGVGKGDLPLLAGAGHDLARGKNLHGLVAVAGGAVKH